MLCCNSKNCICLKAVFPTVINFYYFLKGSRSGAAAVFTLMDLRYDEDPAVVAVQGNHMKKLELEQCIQIMNEMKEAIKDKQFDKALSLRGK